MITLAEIKLVRAFQPEECATCGHTGFPNEMDFHFTSEDESSYAYFCDKECADDYEDYN